MKSDKLRNVPLKNYIILGIVILVTLFILYYFYLWVDAYKESKINIPIMDKYMMVINYNELDNYIVENPDSIVYVSVLENEDIREFEKELKGIYKNNGINKDVLYMDITSDILDGDTKNEMISKYFMNQINILDVPCLLVFSDGELKSIYSIKENGYSASRFAVYVNNIDRDDV